MGRALSNTADYFPHMAKPGKTLFILKSRFGNNGYAFWFQLLEILASSENHYVDCREEDAWQYLLSYTGVDEISGTEILALLAKLGKIDQSLWKQRVIWCEKLVLNLEWVYRKRRRDLPPKPILLDNKLVSVTPNAISDTEIPHKTITANIPVAVIPQSIVKHSIVKHSIAEHTADLTDLCQFILQKSKTAVTAAGVDQLRDWVAEYGIENIRCAAEKAEQSQPSGFGMAYLSKVLDGNVKNRQWIGGNGHGQRSAIPGNENSGVLAQYVRYSEGQVAT